MNRNLVMEKLEAKWLTSHPVQRRINYAGVCAKFGKIGKSQIKQLFFKKLRQYQVQPTSMPSSKAVRHGRVFARGIVFKALSNATQLDICKGSGTKNAHY